MQLFSLLLLFLGVSVPCTAHRGVIGHSGSHYMQKRQEGLPPEQCAKVVTSEYCTGGYNQELSELYARCNIVDRAIFYQDVCRRNSNGNFCGIVNVDALNSNIERACNASITALSCMDECRNSISSARADAGCCVNLYNASGGSFSFPYLFDYTLWSQCGIEPVTEECTQSTITLELPRSTFPGPPTCSDLELAEETASINCRGSYLETIRDSIEATADCRGVGLGFYQSFVGRCAVNEAGQYCFSLEASLEPALDAAQTNCTDTCDSSCSQALQNFVDIGGCCINHYNMLNGSNLGAYPMPWLTYQFWTDCGLETPGFCETRLSTSPTDAAIDSHAAIFKTPGPVVFFAAALFLVHYY